MFHIIYIFLIYTYFVTPHLALQKIISNVFISFIIYLFVEFVMYKMLSILMILLAEAPANNIK